LLCKKGCAYVNLRSLGKIDKKNLQKNGAKMSRNLQKFVKMRAFLTKTSKKLALFVF